MIKNYYLLFLLLILDLCIIILHLFFSSHPYLGSLFDLGKEANFPTWYSSFKLTLAGAIALLIFVQERVSNHINSNQIFKPKYWIFVACLMFFMSADETAQIHETLIRWFMQTRAGEQLLLNLEIGKTGGTLVWGLIFSPILIIIAFSLIKFYISRFKKNYFLITLSLAVIVLFIGSFLLEHQQAHLAGLLEQITIEQFQLYQLMSAIEESFELFASSLLVIIHFYYLSVVHQSITRATIK